MDKLQDNPNYELCKACGGTGWAYAWHDPPLYPTPTSAQYMTYIPCPRCKYGTQREEQKK